MTSPLSPTKRFVLHSLWVVLPFCVLLGLTWNAWRSDAETRRNRILESAIRVAESALADASNRLGTWSPVPEADHAGTPPLPADDPNAVEALKRYEAGDFEGVLGSPESLRSAAGLPLRSLAALQLLRRETDPVRLAELVTVLTSTTDFVTPLFLEEAEKRFGELKIPRPSTFIGWRERWQRAKVEALLLSEIEESIPEMWKEHDGVIYLIEFRARSGEWRVHTEAEVRTAADLALHAPTVDLADGLALRLTVAGKAVTGGAELQVFHSLAFGGWKIEVVLADAEAYDRSEKRTRNFITAVILVAGLAALFGLYQSGRAYFRAVGLARRQSEFMAAVSHEMRTPLAAMGLLAENLASGVADRAGQRDDHTRMIREECARLGGLVDNVLAFTRDKPSDACEAFDVPAMVADAAALVRPVAERNQVALQVDVAEFPEAPHGDSQALRRALLNLLDNALKHTPVGGKVTCHARPLDESHWSIEITDTGPGIPANERVRIFEPFYRIGDELRRTTPGTGLGLALVKRTAEAHGGRVEVCDAPQGGSIFTLTLPIHP